MINPPHNPHPCTLLSFPPLPPHHLPRPMPLEFTPLPMPQSPQPVAEMPRFMNWPDEGLVVGQVSKLLYKGKWVP